MSKIYKRSAIITCLDCGVVVLSAHVTRKRCARCAKIAHARQGCESQQRHIEDVRKRDAARKSIARNVNPEKFKIASLEWRKNHREESRQRVIKWREENPGKANLAAKRYYDNNPEKTLAWRVKMKAELREYARRYEETHPDASRLRSNKRRARELSAPGEHTTLQFMALCEIKNWECSYCGKHLTVKAATRDHITPLSRGGSNSIDNIAPSCIFCNVQKGTKTAEEYAVYLSRIHPMRLTAVM